MNRKICKMVLLPKHKTWELLVCALITAGFFSGNGIAVADSHFDVRLKMIAQPQNTGPCLASLLGPPTKNCIQWQPNVDASPTFEPARRLFFVGAGDDFLHVLDADLGYNTAQIATIGRVITDTVFSADRTILYVGTDKGVIHAMDAFSFIRIFSFTADSKINNNLTMVADSLVFTSAVGSVYSIDGKTGAMRWQTKQPLLGERLRLSSNSNIFVHEEVSMGKKETNLIVPHADGYVSVISALSGMVKKQVTLGINRPNGFPDIVAPMIPLKNQLWIASYDHGLFSLDLGSWQIREHVNVSEIVQLALDGTILYAATPNALLAISEMGGVIWKNNVADIKTKLAPLGYPFDRMVGGEKRLFFGIPSRLLIHQGHGALIMATSAGSIGVFNKSTGQLKKIVGNSTGFGPNIDLVGPDSFAAMSRRGLLMKFQFSDHGAGLKR